MRWSFDEVLLAVRLSDRAGEGLGFLGLVVLVIGFQNL